MKIYRKSRFFSQKYQATFELPNLCNLYLIYAFLAYYFLLLTFKPILFLNLIIILMWRYPFNILTLIYYTTLYPLYYCSIITNFIK